ncbi:MAG: Maf family protein [Candidatus Thermoplasmatota archaeon]|nr:Maf family protein [Candidatus Thermoplasmatota archaeon]
MAKLVLASASPRRREILGMMGIEFEAVNSQVGEEQKGKEIPRRYVLRLAKEKAEAVAQKYPGEWILAADTAVVLGNKIIGKPRDGADAERILSKLSGKQHKVLTGIALFNGRCCMMNIVSSKVKFRKLSAQEIKNYVNTGEPMDKAGAYGIQGRGAFLVESVSGSYTNVIGLPVKETREMLSMAGIL